jgi:hypothetical protein
MAPSSAASSAPVAPLARRRGYALKQVDDEGIGRAVDDIALYNVDLHRFSS